MGHGKTSCEILLAQLRKYKTQQPPYDASYIPAQNTPLTWWQTCYDGKNYLQALAVKMFSITPHSASCERVFSALGWLFGKRRQRLHLETLESMAKIHRYTMAHAKSEFGHVGKLYNEQQIRELIDQAYNDVEDNMEDTDNHEEWVETNEDTEEIPIENGNTLDVENIVDLRPWVVIEAWEEGEKEEESESEDDNDYDPVEIAQRFLSEEEPSEEPSEEEPSEEPSEEELSEELSEKVSEQLSEEIPEL